MLKLFGGYDFTSIGTITDAKAIAKHTCSAAASFKFNFAYQITVGYLAHRTVHENKVYSQHTYRHPLSVSVIFMGMD